MQINPHLINEIVDGGIRRERHGFVIIREGFAQQLIKDVIIPFDGQLKRDP